MSEAVNPYQSPETPAVPVKPLLAQGTLTETMLIYLKGASPWLRFIGILGFINSALVLLWAVSMFAIVPLVWQSWDQIPWFEPVGGIMGAASGVVMAVLCILLALLIFLPALFLYRFGHRIRNYLASGADQDLEQAFKNNKAFWKFVGIICIVQVAFFPLLIIGGIVAGVASAFF